MESTVKYVLSVGAVKFNMNTINIHVAWILEMLPVYINDLALWLRKDWDKLYTRKLRLLIMQLQRGNSITIDSAHNISE